MKKLLSLFLSMVLILSCVPITVFASTVADATITVDTTSAAAGAIVDVNVSIANNPGIAGATFTIQHHEDLMLLSATNGSAFAELDYTPSGTLSNPCNFTWDSENAEATADGVFLTLTFKVSESAVENAKLNVNVSYRYGDIFNNDKDITLDIVNGNVVVLDYIPGDVFEDGVINAKDTRLIRQHIAGGYDITINESAGDVNDDGVINAKDTRLIRRFIAGGYDVVLLPSTPKCQHSMTATSAVDATCTKDGNIPYWQCEDCDKYFSDEDGKTEIELEDTVIPASHTLTYVSAQAASPAEKGWIEHWCCSACGKYFANSSATIELTEKDVFIDPITRAESVVIFNIYGSDPYLESIGIDHPKSQTFYSEDGLVLNDLIAPAGYVFKGWTTAAGAPVIEIPPSSSSRQIVLNATWSKVEYTVQYKSSLFIERAQDTYTVDTGLVLPTPKLSNYAFVGWSNEKGELLTKASIPVGTTGNLILEGNWTSERNKTWTKQDLDAPIIDIDEENGVILFAYEIGEVQNVPLYTIKDFGYISGDGITKTEKTTYNVTISDTMMKAYAKSIAMATTESSNWTLSNTWNESTSINEEWCKENGKNIEETDTIAKSDSQNWNISNSKSGSTETTSLTTNQEGWKNEVKVNSSNSKTDSNSTTDKTTDNQAWNVDAKLSYTPKSYSFGIDAFEVGGLEASTSGGWGGEIGGGYEHQWGEEHVDTEEHSSTSASGFELGGSHDKSTLTTTGTTSTASWNSAYSYGGSSTNSTTQSISTALSEKISNTYGYGSSYAAGGESGTSQGLSSSQTDSESYSASVTYSTATSNEISSEWTTQSTKAGYHRWVVAGTAHVFAVVGYDITKQSYFVYTYSVMDDETHEFEDYSYTTGSYNDHENGVISFEIPYEVAEYVGELTSYSDGLKIDQETGKISEYKGQDTCVVIPEYWNVGNGDVVKVTGIEKGAFMGNENICAVVLSDFITEIPDYAFQGCTSLKEISGGKVTSIGSFAFDGCTDVEDLGVRSTVKHLGEKAFGGVRRIIVNAVDKDVLIAAIESGAEQIIVSLEYMDDSIQTLKGVGLTVPAGTKFFEINGNQKTYEDFSLVSNAEITILNKIHFNGKSKIPVIINSPEVVLNQSTITASGIGLVLGADVTHLGLQGNITIQSANENTVLAKDLSLYEINKNVVGKLIIKDKLLQCGTTDGSDYLSYVDYEAIDLTTFENLLNSFTLYFNANDGFCDEDSRVVPNSTMLGTLPVPTREHYTFEGWFLADGTEVTNESVFSTGADITVYAQWALVPYKVNWATGTGYTIVVSRTSSPYANANIGALSSGDIIYYGDVLSVSYTADPYYSLVYSGITSATVVGNVTSSNIYAEAILNPVSGWVKASELPAGAQVINRKYSYTQRNYMESKNTSESGWTQYDKYWVNAGTSSFNYASFPSGYDTNNGYYKNWNRSPVSPYENTTAKRTVSNSHAGYVYWHWMYNVAYANNTNRAISSKSGTHGGLAYSYFYAIASSVDCPYLDNYYCNSQNLPSYNCSSILPKSTSTTDGMGTPRFFRFAYNTCTYTDYYRMFKYYKDTSHESTSYPNGSDISNIVEWVQYRAK